METMMAARYLGPNHLEPVEVPLPAVGPDEALVEVEACGFCGSDLGIVAGTHPRAKAPLTIGHEFCGRVARMSGTGGGIREGDRVTSYPLISCGKCFICREGQPHVCRTLRLYGFDEDGGMAQFVKLPVQSLLPLPSPITARMGALIEPLAVALHGVAQIPLQRVRTCVVIGCGPIGLLTGLGLRSRGVPEIYLSDPVESRRLLAEAIGFTAVSPGDLRDLVYRATGGEGADAVFECAGVPDAAVQMIQLVRPQGQIVNLGVFKNPAELDLQAVNFKELKLIGSRVYTREDFAEAIRLAPSLPLGLLVTHSYPLPGVAAAFERFRRRDGVCKVIIEPNRHA
jgi:(R,R)-butanediol dehydrogenase/meso-butanediol dehydrogenase/diacetyl reductase